MATEAQHEVRLDRAGGGSERGRSLFGSLALGYLLAVFLLGWLVWAGGGWNLLANTRLLSLLYRAGVVALTDADQGLAQGAPHPDYFLASQDPVDWILLPVVFALLITMWYLRGVLFSAFARFAGASGTVREHTAAYLYGNGLNFLLPYRLGDVGTAAAMEDKGVQLEASAQASFLDQVFVVVNIVVFSVVAILTVEGTTGLTTLLWEELLLLAAFLIVRNSGMRGSKEEGRPGWFRSAGQGLATLAHYPSVFIRVTVISLLAFGLEIVSAYVISQAFGGDFVILNADFRVLMLGVIAGHIAALIPLTPGGIGQFEWGFTLALFIGGLGIPEAVTIAVLYGVFRWVTAMFLMWIAKRTNVTTNTREVFGLIRDEAEVTA